MPKKEAKRPKGRPKAEKPLESIVSLKGTDDLRKWLDKVTEASDSGTRSHMLRRAVKAFAIENGVQEPMPKR